MTDAPIPAAAAGGAATLGRAVCAGGSIDCLQVVVLPVLPGRSSGEGLIRLHAPGGQEFGVKSDVCATNVQALSVHHGGALAQNKVQPAKEVRP